MYAPAAALGSRHARVRQLMADASLDALIVSKLPNIFYLTNLHASAGLVVVTPTQLYLVADFRYSAAVHRLLASQGAPPDTLFRLVERSYDDSLVDVLKGLGGIRLGFESRHVTVRQHATWAAGLGAASVTAELVSTDGLVERLRSVKDGFEQRVLREAGTLLSEVARGVLAQLREPGRTERDLAAEIDWRLKRGGFDRPAFDTIVASGPNAALPHAHPTDRRVEAGDLLLFDFGGVLHGYCVDLTRTVAVGPVTAEQRRIYRAVYDAQQAAIGTAAAGVTADRVDAAARDLLTDRGLGEAFGHSTGHGLGIEVHEDPPVARRRPGGPEPVMLERGMVFTIEPGAYLPDFGGVRLEDDVTIGASEGELLTDVPYDDRLM